MSRGGSWFGFKYVSSVNFFGHNHEIVIFRNYFLEYALVTLQSADLHSQLSYNKYGRVYGAHKSLFDDGNLITSLCHFLLGAWCSWSVGRICPSELPTYSALLGLCS